MEGISESRNTSAKRYWIEDKVFVPIGSLVLGVGFMFLFFGGTVEGVRFGLELFGVVYILNLSYSVIKSGYLKSREEKKAREFVEETNKKYFNK